MTELQEDKASGKIQEDKDSGRQISTKIKLQDDKASERKVKLSDLTTHLE
jgi:hypothetical protein